MANPDESTAKSQRFNTVETAHIEVYGRMGQLVGVIKNISKTGALVELTRGEYIPTNGDLVQMTIHLQSIRKTHYKDAQVIWNNGLSFGVRFVSKTDVLEKLFKK